jgi:hemoglobin-like flavoprotein
MSEQATLRDTLSDALDNYEAPVETVTETPQETASEHTERLRDDVGRFTKAESTEAEKPLEAVETPIEVPKTPRPTSWKKDYEQDWEKLPPNIQSYLNEREGQYAQGVSTYKNQWDSAQPIYEAIQPFMPELQQHNINPAQWIQNLGNAHRTLAMGSPEQKVQMFAKLATEYGVNLQALTGQQFDPQFSQLANELNQVKNQWNQFQTQREQEQQAALNADIQAFAATAPHFEELKPTMTKLLQSEVAGSLKEAYDKALRLHDDLWQKAQAEQAKQAAAEHQKELALKKAKAVSPKSTSPTATMNGSGGKKGIREALEESFDSVGNLI